MSNSIIIIFFFSRRIIVLIITRFHWDSCFIYLKPIVDIISWLAMAIYTITTQNKENLPAIIAGKANHPMAMIAMFNKRQAIFAGDDHCRQTVALLLGWLVCVKYQLHRLLYTDERKLEICGTNPSLDTNFSLSIFKLANRRPCPEN